MSSQRDGGPGAAPDNGVMDLRLVYGAFVVLATLGFLGALLYAIATSSTAGAAAGVFGGAALVAGAFALAGGLVGFVFAIPRSRQAEQLPKLDPGATGAAHQRQSDYAANTNLEQISDWLTKILVGVSLIQFDAISNRLANTATELAPLLGGGSAGRPVTIALMTHFTLWGFFFAYLSTRLWLPKALSRAEREEEVRQREAEQDAELHDLERRAYDFLYQAAPGGFTRAIEAIEAYHGKRGSLQSQWLWLYLAAAYGQKHAFEQAQGHQAAADEAKERARAAVEQAVALDPGTRPILAQLYRGTDPNESDLSSLQGDPRLDELLGT